MPMKNQKIDCGRSRRIVSSFIDFLNSVEPAPGVDKEALEVTKECLINVFKLDASSLGHKRNPSLLGMFELPERSEKQKIISDFRSVGTKVKEVAPISYSLENDDDDDSDSEPLNLKGDDEWASKLSTLGISKDELIGQYFTALEDMKYFSTSIDGNDDLIKVPKVTRLLQDAFMEMESSGDHRTYSLINLADSLKKQGNKAMELKWYNEAIALYTCAVSLCKNNAFYYCNRAAALINVHEYKEAISDCEKAIEIDPSYIKAYNRLGLAYLAQGSYRDSIDKGFQKVVQLEPRNQDAKENIRIAKSKLRAHSSSMSSGPNGPVEPGSIPGISINASGIAPENIATHIMNLFRAAGVGVRGDAGDPRGPRRD